MLSLSGITRDDGGEYRHMTFSTMTDWHEFVVGTLLIMMDAPWGRTMWSSSSHFTDVLSSHKLSTHRLVVPHTADCFYAAIFKYSHELYLCETPATLYVFFGSTINERLNKINVIITITTGGNFTRSLAHWMSLFVSLGLFWKIDQVLLRISFVSQTTSHTA